MREAVDEVLARHDGVATRALLLRAISAAELDDEIRRGRLTRVFRRTYCRPWDADLRRTRERAAVLSIGHPVVLSHATALRRWGLGDDHGTIHVTTPDDRTSRPQPGLIVHRAARAPRMVRLDGLPTVRAAVAVVTSWPVLPPAARRAPVIEGVRRAVVTPEELGREIDTCTRLPGRRELGRLVDLVAAGCQSELEIWGLLGVFDVPGLRQAVRQRPVSVGGATYYLDLAYDDERVAVELDGDRFHSTRRARDRDRRRDAALAGVGWLTLRFSYDRLTTDVDGCRHDTLRTLASRRR